MQTVFYNILVDPITVAATDDRDVMFDDNGNMYSDSCAFAQPLEHLHVVYLFVSLLFFCLFAIFQDKNLYLFAQRNGVVQSS